MPITPSTVPSFYGTTENCDIFLSQYTPYAPNASDDSVGGGIGYDTTTGEDLNNLFQIVNLDPVIKPSDTQFAKIFLKNTTAKTLYDIRVWIEQSAGAPEVWGIAVESEKNMDNRDTVTNPASTIPNSNTSPDNTLLANYGTGQWQNPIGFTNAIFINPLQEAAVLEPGDTIAVWIKREMTYSNLMSAGGPGEMIIGVVFGVSS
jgi:hypothetical protein